MAASHSDADKVHVRSEQLIRHVQLIAIQVEKTAAKLRVASALCEDAFLREQAEEAAAVAEASPLLQLDVKQEQVEKDQADRIAAALRQEVAAVRAADASDATAYHVQVSDFVTSVFNQSVRMSEEVETASQNMDERMQQVVSMERGNEEPAVTGTSHTEPAVPDPDTGVAAAQTIQDLDAIWDDFDE